MHKKKWLSIFLRLLLATTLFFFDILCFGFFEQRMVFSLACLLIVLTMQSNRIIAPTYCALLLAIQSTLFYGRFGFGLITLLPLLILGKLMRKMIPAPIIISGAIIALDLALSSLVVEPFLLGTSPAISYTMRIICVNLVLIMLLSLKLQNGRLGNRFRALA